jgi:hypothetical protein
MSQATLEPAVADAALGSPTDESGGASADDQLSKLAGNEIDRLLAESESGQGPVQDLPPARMEAGSNASINEKEQVDLAVPLDDLVEGMDQPGGAPEPKPAPAATATEEIAEADTAAAEEARLNVLAGELEVDQPAAEEKSVVAEPAAVAVQAAPTVPVKQKPEPEPSPLLKLLIRINAPLAGCSNTVRKLMGMGAIMMFLNAVALLVYVLVFRKTH